jgi:hypothetical protein
MITNQKFLADAVTIARSRDRLMTKVAALATTTVLSSVVILGLWFQHSPRTAQAVQLPSQTAAAVLLEGVEINKAAKNVKPGEHEQYLRNLLQSAPGPGGISQASLGPLLDRVK